MVSLLTVLTLLTEEWWGDVGEGGDGCQPGQSRPPLPVDAAFASVAGLGSAAGVEPAAGLGESLESADFADSFSALGFSPFRSLKSVS